MFEFGQTHNSKRLYGVARIVFCRLTEQLSSEPTSEDAWEYGLEGFAQNPEMFPLIETCIDAAGEILRFLDSENRN